MILLSLSHLIQFLTNDVPESNSGTDVFPLKRLVHISMLYKETERMKQHIQCITVCKYVSCHTFMRI